MAIKIEMLKYFAKVVEHGNLTEAADALARTPSAVSMMLKQFEAHIGAPLFESSRKSRLTPIGELIYEEARREISHFSNTVAMIEGLARSEYGYLRLAVTPSVANVVLPAIVFQFTKTHPKVQIDIRDMDSAAITNELSRERADIGIGTLGTIDGMNRIELFSDAFGVVCRKDHPLAQNWDQLTWRDMSEYVLIANGLCDLINDPDFAPILANSRLMVPNTASLLALVRADVGISVLPRLAVSNLQDNIAFLPLKDVNARRSVCMVSQPSNLLLPAAQDFLTLVTNMSRNGSFGIQS